MAGPATRRLSGTVLAAVLLAASGLAAAEGPRLAAGHAGTPCVACHPPGQPGGRPTRCSGDGCHADVTRTYLSSDHDRRHLTASQLACTACHGGHPVVSGRAALTLACENRVERVCSGCHEAERYAVGAPAPSRKSIPARGGGVHTSARERRGCEAVAISCFTCHGSHTILAPGNRESPVSRQRIAVTCGRCHPEELERYRASSHAAGVAASDGVSPTCVSCHGAHAIAPATGMRTPTGAEEVVFTCAECHEDPDVLRISGLPLAVIDSYESSVHGIAYAHGIHDVATCVSCHGAHLVLAASNPRSKVNPDNIRTTCAACHGSVSAGMLAAVRHPGGRPGVRGVLARLKLYFPVAGTSVNPLLVSGMGGVVGILSGIFGVGGGFLMTPLLILIGIPAAVAAATDAAQITAGASSGAISHARLGNVDFRMGLAMVAGSWPGGFVGVQVVHALRTMGNFDFFLKLLYVLLLGFTGITMFVEGVRTLRGRSPGPEPGPGRLSRLFDRLPIQVSFPKSGLRTSVFVPITAGFVVGILAAFLGVGGGFILMPVMIYMIGIPTRVAVGTGLFQIVLTCAYVTLQQSVTNHTVDVLLAVALFAGSTIGAQLGVMASRRLKGEQIRVLLAVIVLGVMLVLLYQLMATPEHLIQFATSGGGH
jgi:uncharacterized protein